MSPLDRDNARIAETIPFASVETSMNEVDAEDDDVDDFASGPRELGEETKESGSGETAEEEEEIDAPMDEDAEGKEVDTRDTSLGNAAQGGGPKRNLLKEKYHDLFLELFRAPNPGVDVEDMDMDSARIVNWQCSDCLKQFQKSVVERVYLTKECPHCLQSAFKPLAEERPEIAKEWATLKNPMYLHPKHVDITSLDKVTWQCAKCSFEFETSVKQRCLGAACPRCVPKHGNWADRFPDIAKQWHPLRNGDLRFTDVNESEDRMIWWMCPSCSYEYEEGIYKRLYKDKSCPLCSQDHRENVN